MIKSLLVANRGEIACRIMRTARKMGIRVIAVHSDADKNSLHVRLADDAIFIGPAPATQSYLNQKKIIDAAKLSGADAIHPGYGFLSENYEFARLVERNGINFVGPSADAIRKMGDKIEAKKIAKEAKVSIVDGYMGDIKTEKDALRIAKKVGYPIMLKAAAGGGGKGMRVVRTEDEMQQAFQSTKNEAQNNFSDGRTFIEKFIESPRHIEIQILGDKHGNYVCLGERECSIQRHHQKVIEEAPSSFLDEKTRKKMYAQSIALAKEVGYFSAGTIEYIVDQKKNFFFLEMNTRLQVEHPVTELVTGFDIVELMIRVAMGEVLPIKQADVKLNGWAIEGRVYAEDPSSGFIPSTGRITTYSEPSTSCNVRIDSGIYEGGEVSMFYDAMIAKACSYAETRDQAIQILNQALDQYIIRGISHNISFLQAILTSERFQKANLSTNFIDEEYRDGFAGSVLKSEESSVILCAAVFVFLTDKKRCTTLSDQMRSANKWIGTRWVISLDGVYYPVTVRPIDDGYKISFENRRFFITSRWLLGSKLLQCTINQHKYSLQINYLKGCTELLIEFRGVKSNATLFTPRAAELNKFMKVFDGDSDVKEIESFISGMVSDVKVSVGDYISKGQPLVVIEAMKMENVITSKVEGKVAAVNIKTGDICSLGDVLIVIE